MKRAAYLLFVVCAMACKGQTTSRGEGTLIYVDIERLEKAKALARADKEPFASAVRSLLKSADKMLSEKPLSVMDKTQTPPSGDKHDYLSLAPYWWPDPKKKDGLPWIRKDGKINPKTRGNHTDIKRAQKFCRIVAGLSWAYYYSDDEKYAAKTVEFLETWFVNPKTRMNPNVKYAQAVPGSCDGRPFGIIELSGLSSVITAIQILDRNHRLSPQSRTVLDQWFKDYLKCLETSELGRREAQTTNNHGNHYDRQAIGIMLLTGQTEKAVRALEEIKTRRIAAQIARDGGMPAELKRTKSLSYSMMNLRCFTENAAMARRFGVDLWNYKTPDGRGIQLAYKFLAPYAEGKKPWKFKQIANPQGTLKKLPHLFAEAAAIMDEAGFYPKIAARSPIKGDMERLKCPIIR